MLRADLSQLAATLADLDAKLATARASIDKLVANITAQKVLIDSRTKRTAMHQTLADQGWDSRAVVLQSLEPLRQDQVHLADYEGELAQDKAAIPVLEDQKNAARETFIAENVTAAVTAERATAIGEEELKAARLALDNLTLRAPVAGMVEGLAATSLGQSVKAGEMLMQIVPDTAPLEITAYVLNTDIGFVKVGQPATIKIDTFSLHALRHDLGQGRQGRRRRDRRAAGRLAAGQRRDDHLERRAIGNERDAADEGLGVPRHGHARQDDDAGQRARRAARGRHVGCRRDRDRAAPRDHLFPLSADPRLPAVRLSRQSRSPAGADVPVATPVRTAVRLPAKYITRVLRGPTPW